MGSRPPAGGPASKTPGPASKSGGGPASKVSTPGPGPKERKVREGRGRPAKSKEIIDSSVDSGDEPTPGIITETVGSYLDEAGNKVWICPACGKQDDGSPMIGGDQVRTNGESGLVLYQMCGKEAGAVFRWRVS